MFKTHLLSGPSAFAKATADKADTLSSLPAEERAGERRSVIFNHSFFTWKHLFNDV
jgi:hypothetical protein